MKRMIYGVVVAMVMALNVGCDLLLDVDNYEQPLSTLTADVNFTASEQPVIRQFDVLYPDFRNHQSFVVELIGPEVDGKRDAVVLDLLAPKTTLSIEGEYTVGFTGDYIALPRLDLINNATGMMQYGGSYYGKAMDGVIGDYYGFLTEGKVMVSSLDGEYFITVDAKSEEHNIWAYYHGPVEIIRGK
ncbi:MAG: hypothetical protein J6R93_07040 [Tidjanibacter sp.]|nr:hypothetical protein [Tidjanibacter sp.]